jgi:hypothetical protein
MMQIYNYFHKNLSITLPKVFIHFFIVLFWDELIDILTNEMRI